ncbi:MAG: hypothetical protein ACRD2T_04295, partial [Thermoanaerobaculia bacterium]
STDARLLIARRESERGWRWFVLIGGSTLQLAGRTALQARARASVLTLSLEGSAPTVQAPAGVEAACIERPC